MKWGTIFKSTDDIQAYLVANWLREKGFKVEVFSKKDTMFSMFGKVELRVPADQFAEAKETLDSFLEKDEEE